MVDTTGKEDFVAAINQRYGASLDREVQELYSAAPSAVGVALSAWKCGCVALRAFDADGCLAGGPRLLCDHPPCDNQAADPAGPQVCHRAIFWKDPPEVFDDTYGNDRRLEIAARLFPVS